MSPVISCGLVNAIAKALDSIGTHIYYVEYQDSAKSLVFQSLNRIRDRKIYRIQSRAVEDSCLDKQLTLPCLIPIQERGRRIDSQPQTFTRSRFLVELRYEGKPADGNDYLVHEKGSRCHRDR